MYVKRECVYQWKEKSDDAQSRELRSIAPLTAYKSLVYDLFLHSHHPLLMYIASSSKVLNQSLDIMDWRNSINSDAFEIHAHKTVDIIFKASQ